MKPFVTYLLSRPGFATALLCCVLTQNSRAGSATWKKNPTSSSWNAPENWRPATVPNGPGDIAIFGVTRQFLITLDSAVEVGDIDFSSGASAYSISVPSAVALTISGGGIMNASGQTQSFACSADDSGYVGSITFLNGAGAGTLTHFTVAAGVVEGVIGSYIEFFGNSSAQAAGFLLEGGEQSGTSGGEVGFFENSTAAAATFVSNGATGENAYGGVVALEGMPALVRPHSSTTAPLEQPMSGRILILEKVQPLEAPRSRSTVRQRM